MDKKKPYITEYLDGSFIKYDDVSEYIEQMDAEREYVIDHQFKPEPPKCITEGVAAASCDIAQYISELLSEENGESKE